MKKLYYDSLVYDPDNLKFMIERFGQSKSLPDLIDYPFLLLEKPVGKVIDNLTDISEEDVSLMLGQNALHCGFHHFQNNLRTF